MLKPATVDWIQIDTVLLDMDGTLLDLKFDNWFWLEHVPQLYAAANGLTALEASAFLEPKFLQMRGTLEWYCVDYWSRELRLDIASLKRAAHAQVTYLPGAEEFLLQLGRMGKRRVLVTNAHPTTLAIKNDRLSLTPHFDACYSTHHFAAPKEDSRFWPRLRGVEPFRLERTLFVDDSVPVLDAAHRFGVGCLRGICLPDSGRPARDMHPYPSVERVLELL